MAKLAFVLAAVSALAPSVTARPQLVNLPAEPHVCPKPIEEYEVTDISKPYYTKAEPVGGSSCVAGAKGTCQSQKSYEHSVGVTQSISGGLTGALDLGKIFNIGASLGYEYSWSTEDATAVATYATCPDVDKGSYTCAMQVRPKKVKTKGKVHRYFPDGCDDDTDFGWVDYEVEAPALSSGGPNKDSNVMATFEPCIVSCTGDNDGLDCDGVKAAQKLDVPLCPETKSKVEYKKGWCTAHIIQHQRWHGAVNDRFKFTLEIFDDDENRFYHQLFQEVDGDGNLSITSLLPWTLEIKTKGEDNDFVDMCYADQCWSCDDDNGGGHGCSLGDGKEHGYENNKREGDFGFTC